MLHFYCAIYAMLRGEDFKNVLICFFYLLNYLFFDYLRIYFID